MSETLSAKEFQEQIRSGEIVYEKGKFKHGKVSEEFKKIQKDRREGWIQGWRTIGGKKNYYRSKWEANYARYLQLLKEQGEIKDWEHENKTFWFEAIKRGTRSYLPDFEVTLKNGEVQYHEVKGWYDPKSKTKMKRMGKYHPDVKLVMITQEFFKANNKKLKSVISGYE